MNNNLPRRKSDRQAGFTLIEVLVGLIISASIMAGLTTLASSVNLGWGKVTRKLSSQETIGNGLTIAAGDIYRIQRIADHGLAQAAFRFRGEPSSITFIIPERSASSVSGLYWVHLFNRRTSLGTALVRARAPFDAKLVSLAAVNWVDEVVLSEGTVSFDFSYRPAHNAPETWVREWSEVDTLPGLVRIQMSDFRTGVEIYPSMVIAPKIGAEAACANTESAECTMKSAGKLMSEMN